MHLERLSRRLVALLQLLDDVGLAGGREERRQPVVVLHDLVRDRPAGDPCPASAPSSGRGTRPPSSCSSRCGTASSRRPATCSCAGRCRCCTARSCPRRSRARRAGRGAGPRSCRGRSSCRGTGTASVRPVPGSRRFVCVRKCMCVKFTQQKNGLRRRVLALDVVARGRRELVVDTSPSASSSADPCPGSAACRRGPSADAPSGRPSSVAYAAQHAARAEPLAEPLEVRASSGSPGPPAPPRRSGGRGCRRTRRSRGRSGGTRSGRRGGSCRTGPWRSPWFLSSSAIVGSSSWRPTGAPGSPTLLNPVRKTLWPVMNDDRPAVQLCSP